MLSDVIGSSGLSFFAELGLVIFLVTFLFMAVRVLRKNKEDYARIANLPLSDDGVTRSSEP